MNPETDIICLQIVKGIPKAPGDIESAEQELVTMDLLDANGLSVQSDGWTLALPGIKRNGTWADTQVSDGRTLIAAPHENVTETMALAIGNTDLRQRYQILAKLQRLADDARDFWTGNYQIEPVYLKFKANGARVYQYALIYDLSIATSNDPYETTEAWQINITLEREYAWRMVVPPGGNPLEYWFWSQGKTRGVDYDWEDLSLRANTDHFLYEDLDNSVEFNGLDHTQFLTKSWVDIDGDSIPGDAPALTLINVLHTQSFNQIYIARSTEPRSRYNRFVNGQAYMRNVLNAADGDTLFTATPIDACGVYCQDQTVNRLIATYTIPAGPDADFAAGTEDLLVWSANNAFNFPMTRNQWSGEWAVYLRCQQTNGTEGDVEARIRIRFGNSTGYTESVLPASIMPVQDLGCGSCNCQFDSIYMGRVSIPPDGNAQNSIEGTGLVNDSDTSTEDRWSVRLDVRNTISSTRDLEFLDLWFMPINEGFCMWNADASVTNYVTGVAPGGSCLVDNTGYLLHGNTETLSAHTFNNTEQSDTIQLSGESFHLKPRVDNRIYFLFRYYDSGGGVRNQQWSGAVLTNEQTAIINIVPRCYGVADL